MTDRPNVASQQARSEAVAARVTRRRRAEKRFRAYGLLAIVAAVGVLAALVLSVAWKGVSGFRQTFVRLEIAFDPDVIDPDRTGDIDVFEGANYQALARRTLQELFPDVTERAAKLRLYGMLSSDARMTLRAMVLSDHKLIGTSRSLWLMASDDVDSFEKGLIDREVPEADRRIKNDEIAWLDSLRSRGDVDVRFSTTFFTAGDSREPEQAGIRGALVGSARTLLVALLLSFPVGVLAAIYLEEFAPRNRWTDLIEVNINNLAAVPSILFGLLGLAVFLNFFGMPRSAPLVGGLVLALMTLPTIIIAARAALEAVPLSIREAALGVGASSVQVVMHHVLPLATPGILTGTILGMARALGETAPLLMIGMVAFIVDVPTAFTDPATVMPVQIFLWSGSPERAFVAKTAAAILVLLSFLIAMNAIAVMLRRRFERRW